MSGKRSMAIMVRWRGEDPSYLDSYVALGTEQELDSIYDLLSEAHEEGDIADFKMHEVPKVSPAKEVLKELKEQYRQKREE